MDKAHNQFHRPGPTVSTIYAQKESVFAKNTKQFLDEQNAINQTINYLLFPIPEENEVTRHRHWPRLLAYAFLVFSKARLNRA